MAAKQKVVSGVSPISVLGVHPEVVIVLAHHDGLRQLTKPPGDIIALDITGGLFAKAANPAVRTQSGRSQSACPLTTPPPCAPLPSPPARSHSKASCG